MCDVSANRDPKTNDNVRTVPNRGNSGHGLLPNGGGMTCWYREPDAMRFGWTDSGELEFLGYAYWDGSDGVTCGEGW